MLISGTYSPQAQLRFNLKLPISGEASDFHLGKSHVILAVPITSEPNDPSAPEVVIQPVQVAIVAIIVPPAPFEGHRAVLTPSPIVIRVESGEILIVRPGHRVG